MIDLGKIQGCLMGVMIGDAMGMPVEMMTPEMILEKTGGIDGFINPIQRKIKDTVNLVAGQTTDDWQLTESILQSLIRCGHYNINDIALAHVEAYETSIFGWGGTTRKGLAELKQYYDSRGRLGRSPRKLPEQEVGRGCGNGVAMKIAPITIYQAMITGCSPYRTIRNVVHYSELEHKIADIGRLTHYDIRAWAAAYAVAIITTCALVRPPSKGREPFNLVRLIKLVKNFEDIYSPTERFFKERIGYVL